MGAEMTHSDIVWAVRQNTQDRYNARRLLMWKIKKAAYNQNKQIEPRNPFESKI